MVTTFKDIINNESGFVLVLAVLMLAIMTIMGVAATRTSDIELQIASNERQIVNDFYNAEGAVIDMLENPSTWLTQAFLTADETEASFAGGVDIDDDGADDADVEIRCIHEASSDLPVLPHVVPPPVGSGYSLKYFEVRRYGITATSATGNTQIQVGVWKVFNKPQ